MVCESQGCECTSGCCHPSPVNWKGRVISKIRSGQELANNIKQVKSVPFCFQDTVIQSKIEFV